MQTYPIYSFVVSWYEGLSNERIINGSSCTHMFKSAQSDEQLKADFDVWWEMLSKDKISPVIHNLTIKLKSYDTWNLTWFAHQTFDVGQTDAEALESFEEYVSRHLLISSPDSLMGADDRFRWVANNDGDPAPCRCEHCKKLGFLTINH